MTDILNDLAVDGKITSTGDITDGSSNKLSTVASDVAKIKDGTTTVPNATNTTYIGNNTTNIGTDTKPIKIVNGVATAVTNDLVDVSSAQSIGGRKTFTARMTRYGDSPAISLQDNTYVKGTIPATSREASVDYRDINDRREGYMMFRTLAGSGDSETLIRQWNYDESANNGIRIASGSSNYVDLFAQQRTYNPSNTKDLVTIGSLQASSDVVHRTGNESVAGFKTFTDTIMIGSSSYGLRSQRISNNSNRIFIEDTNSTGDVRATLEMRANDDGTTSLIFRKWKISDGTLLADSVIASL